MSGSDEESIIVIMAHGQTIPAERLGELSANAANPDDHETLAAQMAEHGYVYLREFLPREDVLAAREAIFSQLEAVGEVEAPPLDGIYSGHSERREATEDLGTFWKTVAETWALRRLTHGPDLHRLMSTLFGKPARAQDFIFLRPANRGKFTHVHCDYAFFTRSTETVLTAWVALGDIPTTDGPLFIVEGSHRFDDIVEAQRGFDVARDTSRTAAIMIPPQVFARERNTRLLTTDFAAGDVVIFPMFTLHGSLDNVSAKNRIRLSVDVRFQPADDPMDPRYFGPNPTGTTGAGYGELTGAKPLSDEWHIR